VADALKYWVNTVSRDHVQAGVSGGFTQADHGKNTRLKRLAQDDYLVFYSPRTHFRSGETLQAFTALGRITDTEPHQVEMSPDFHPWRRNMTFLDSHEAPVRPLIEHLAFIKNKESWGYPFRRGLFEVCAEDFRRIAAAMGATVEPA
jgi:hypothetical protein